MPKPKDLGYSDIERVIESGPQDVSWVQQELCGVDLGDKRIDRRLIKTAEQLARSPVSPINEACGNGSGCAWDPSDETAPRTATQ